MSTYLTRIIEVKRPNCSRVIWKDPKKLMPEEFENEEVFNLRFQGESLFYRCIEKNGKKELLGISHPGYHWETLKWYRNTNTNDFFDDYRVIDLKNTNGDKVTMAVHDSFTDNGGSIRDKYLAKYYNPYKLTERGWPEDASPNSISQYDEKWCWGKTYVILSEYLKIAEDEKKDFIRQIRENAVNSEIKLINKKLDAIHDNKEYPRENNEDEEECYEDTIEYLCNEGLLSDIESLNSEITKVWSVVNAIYGWTKEEDIRILYFFS